MQALTRRIGHDSDQWGFPASSMTSIMTRPKEAPPATLIIEEILRAQAVDEKIITARYAGDS
jgi:hypothetical protein